MWQRLLDNKKKLLVFALVFLGSIVFGLFEWRHGQATLVWPATSGKVTERGTSGHRNTLLDMRFTVEYEVRGEPYELTVTDRAFLPNQVEVYYDPDEPSHAVLQRGAEKGMLLAAGLGVAFGFLGFVTYLILAFFPQSGETEYTS